MEDKKCTLYYYEWDEDIIKNRFQEHEDFDSLDEAYDRLKELYDEGTITKNCYENAYIVTESKHKYNVIDISEDDEWEEE